MSQSTRPILLVEDNSHDVELILAAFREANLRNEICVTRDGAEALDFLRCRGAYASRRHEKPGVILLDLKMPKVDGREVLRSVRNDPELWSIPIVVLTSSSEHTDLVQSYQLKANAYVVKPVDFTKFAATVASLGVFWGGLNEPPPARLAARQTDCT